MKKNDYVVSTKIVKKLERIAEKTGRPISEVINDFISDIQEFSEEGYESKTNINLEELTARTRSELAIYLKNKYETKEESDLRRENDKLDETWKSIEEIVERENTENSGKTKPEYWQSIRKLIVNRDNKLSIKMNEEMEKQMISMIDERISSEKDNLYYEQVRAFTNNFSFLRYEPLIARATTGTRNVKFTDRESYDRYCNLRSILQEGHSEEYSKIGMILSEGKVDNGDRRILEQRMKVIQKKTNKILDAR